MSQSSEPSASSSLPESLPPVEPPSAGFIVQLFIIPAVIVAVVIVVWALFNWIAHKGTDPRTYVADLKRNNESRWHAAVNLADELRKSDDAAIKKDPQLAAELAALLESEIAAGSIDDKPVTFRMYLCRVLGEFRLPEVLPPLVKAAVTDRDDRERDVRLGALQALARLIPNLDAQRLRDDARLRNALFQAASDDDAVLRYHAAYALGVLGGDDALRRLAVLAGDANIDVRMNAAVGLARHGDPACVAELARMLDPAETEGMLAEREPAAREAKRAVIYRNALEAAKQFAAAAPTADAAPLTAAVDRLLASNPSPGLRLEAEAARRALAKR